MRITQNKQLVTFVTSSERSEDDIRADIENISKSESFEVLSFKKIVRGKIESEVKHTITLSTSFDEDDGYTIESFSYNDSLAGIGLNNNALDFLKEKSVAINVTTKEPRFDRYEPSKYARNKNLAISMVNKELGFVVTDDESFEIDVEDFDDSLNITLEISDIDAIHLYDLIIEYD